MKSEQPQEVPVQKMQQIIDKRGPLMGPHWLKFFHELVESNVTDMIHNLL